MIVQISMVRNELPLIKEMLPVWKKYSDGFVFMCDTCDDGTEEYLKKVASEYNILSVLTQSQDPDQDLWMETNTRGRLFNEARKYTDKIICLDADEYLDGQLTKQDLENFLNKTKNTTLFLRWVQYTSCNTIRVDGPWENNYKDRIGVYQDSCDFLPTQMHSTHLPIAQDKLYISPDQLFIAHMQWVDKTHVAIKQYYWKVVDYVNNKLYSIKIAGNEAYDASVNNFDWKEEYFLEYPLAISPHVFEKNAIKNNYRLKVIKDFSSKYNIPNLGDWGMDLVNIDESKADEINPYKISVITAIGSPKIYEKYFDLYLESVLSQHMFYQTEHVVVYSEWHEFFDKLSKYQNFKLIKENEKLGVYNAWNIGIRNSTTDYVTNWNVDDLRHPINTKIKYDLLQNNDVDLAYNWYTATANDLESFFNCDLSDRKYIPYPDEYHTRVLENCYAGPDPMWKKSLHEKVGYFDYENYPAIGDWEMWIRFAQKANAKFKLIPEVLCLYKDHPETVSRTYDQVVQTQKTKLFNQYIKK